MALRTAICSSSFVLLASLSHGQVPLPVGSDFRVNAYTTFTQRLPGVAADPEGNFVVVWHSDSQDGSNSGVFAQRFSAAGTRRGGEFQVNTYTSFNQVAAVVAADGRGGFVVAWTGAGQDGSGYGVFAQRYEATGAPRGAEFRVNSFTTSAQYLPAVASDADGNFVVAWGGYAQDGSGYGIFAQRYEATGAPRGGEFRVNTHTTSNQRHPAVVSDAGGNLVIAWASYGQDGSSYGVFAQRYDATGAPRGAEFRVNSYTTDAQGMSGRLALAADAAGNFVVAWGGSTQDGSSEGVFAQLYDATGAPRGAEFRVNSTTAGFQGQPAASVDAAGNFLIVWAGQDGGNFFDNSIFGQRYHSTGAPRGGEFRVNSYTSGYQAYAVAASSAIGNFVVAWSDGFDGGSSGIFARRFGGLDPASLVVDPVAGGASDGNAVLEPGESVTVRPSWRNSSGGNLLVGGAAASFEGPPGATYTIEDGLAVYLLIDGMAQPCTDCYVLAVSDPDTRPALHWDASLLETLLPEGVHGQAKRWSLHVGESFADVSPSSPFYRFIETLLHRGVTAGCSGTAYCPSSPTTREQMAVFVLIAKEGAGYAPVACAPPNIFGDVPETSPFCPFIEELANRAVVGGCGGGNYCASSPVTREQMAVFVLRTLDPALDPPACAPPNMFADVPETSVFCEWIEELARRGVVSGCGGGNYCPEQPVTREQMGVFLGVTFGLTLYGP